MFGILVFQFLKRALSSFGPPTSFGDVAQLVEHYICNVGVRGSNPLISTRGGRVNRASPACPVVNVKRSTIGAVSTNNSG